VTRDDSCVTYQPLEINAISSSFESWFSALVLLGREMGRFESQWLVSAPWSSSVDGLHELHRYPQYDAWFS
jgi:hypothetical protein